jgi:flagellar basal-body rod modification protein FlgD
MSPISALRDPVTAPAAVPLSPIRRAADIATASATPAATAATSSTPAASSTSSTTSGSAAATANSTDPLGNESTFLTLLVSQLQNQDPLNPTDSTQFVSQLAQFSELEQVIAIRNDTDTLASSAAASANAGTGAGSTTNPTTNPTTGGTSSTTTTSTPSNPTLAAL